MSLIKLRCEHMHYPSVKSPGDVGLDLIAHEYLEIHPGLSRWDSGVFVDDIMPGYWIQIVDKSKRAAQGIHIFGGIIDTGYRGELGVILFSVDRRIAIQPGEAVCQIVIHRANYPAETVAVNGNKVGVGLVQRGGNGGLWEVG